MAPDPEQHDLPPFSNLGQHRDKEGGLMSAPAEIVNFSIVRPKERSPSLPRHCTYHTDKNGRNIYEGDKVRYGDFTGVVVFKNAAFRVDTTRFTTGDFLHCNSSLLYQDGVGTKCWEVITRVKSNNNAEVQARPAHCTEG